MDNNESIIVSNKIITVETLNEIFDVMNHKIEKVLKKSRENERKNATENYKTENYDYKDLNSKLTFNIKYYENTTIKYDNYANFMAAFNNRLEEINYISARIDLSYSVKEQNSKARHFFQSIMVFFYEDKVSMHFNLESDDKQLDDVYNFIKQKIQSSPIKYDNIIKKRNAIKTTIVFAKGFIPSIIMCIMLLFVSELRQIIVESHVLFPLGVIVLTFVLGNFFFANKIDKLYENMVPEIKYAGYSKKTGTIFKENIDKYIETSEILIGKNASNMEKRRSIQEQYNKFKKIIPYEFGILIILSIIVLFLK